MQCAVSRMQEGLVHRGPDGEGTWYDETKRLALAMRRLAIIDLESGTQPLFNEEHDIVLVANGEIYNYIELRERLKAKGHRFVTGSDCEVILHAYEDKGVDCLHDLRGMFAFALFDINNNKLVLARDRMGEKPLYLYSDKDTFLFSSELKSLLQSGVVPLELETRSIYWFFHYGYVPDPESPVKNVRKLPAGGLLVADMNTWEISERQWWRIEDSPALEMEPVAAIRAVLDEVANIVIRSDVKIGVALSGGLDSSLVAALAVRHYPGRLEAFSVGYPGRPPCDERKDAHFLANHLGINFHEIEIDEEGMVSGFLDLARLRDDPIADIAGWGYYQVMVAAHEKGVPVMLQGHGGDELFWGYEWVRQCALDNALRQNPGGKGEHCSFAQMTPPPSLHPKAFAHWIADGFGRKSSLARRQRLMGADPNYPTFIDCIPFFADGENIPYTPHFQATIASFGASADARYVYRKKPPWGDVNVLTTGMICGTYLRENGIAQGDRLSMATSVELRLPLLDYRLVETVIGLRKTRPDVSMPAKHWLRLAAAAYLPKEVLQRPKRGFSPPTYQWQARLFKTYGHLLIDGLLVEHGVLTQQGAKDLARGEQPAHAVIPAAFKALILETWLRAMTLATRFS